MPIPQLDVSLLKPEEVPRYVYIRHETFRPTINKILYPRGEPSQKTLDKVAENYHNNIVNDGFPILKCVDTSTNEIIACAKWRYVKPKRAGATERTWEEVDEALADIPEPYDESDPALWAELFALMNHRKRLHLGTRPYYVLDTLVTLPRHERKGAGSSLVRWGCEKADEAGVEAYLEASPMGAPMYARHGFVAVDEFEVDLRKYGGTEVMKLIVSGLISSMMLLTDLVACSLC
jgi:GNAT superfamily N-acetyltransferase